MSSRDPEFEFLPAGHAIEQTPPRPLARAILWSILAFCAVAAVWTTVGEVDIVSVAAGRIVPSDRVKRVQSLHTGRVRVLHVSEGQAVHAGEVLIELDAAQVAGDRARLVAEQRSVERERQRLVLLLARLGSGGMDHTEQVELPAGLQARIVREYQAFDAERLGMGDEARRCGAEGATIDAQIAQLDATLPLLSERAAALRQLAVQALVPRVSWLELEESRVTRARERSVLAARRAIAVAACAQIEQRLAALLARTEAGWRDDLAVAETRLASYALEIGKAALRVAEHTLTAPVDGHVQELAVTTVGGVVTAAEQLMLIVPSAGALLVDAWIPNKDIGFVAVGQAVAVKVDTFPFTEYGTVPGTVLTISPDAVADADRGLAYLAQVGLAASSVQVGARRAALTPGMAVTVEFALGRRRISEFLLAPLLRYREESLTER
jgi:hemolysin D